MLMLIRVNEDDDELAEVLDDLVRVMQQRFEYWGVDALVGLVRNEEKR